MQKANYNLQGMYDLFTREKDTVFEILNKEELKWISSHPLNKERADFL